MTGNLILDFKKLVSIDELCLFALNNHSIVLQSDVLKALGLPAGNSCNHPVGEFVNGIKDINDLRDPIINRMIGLTLLQHVLHWKTPNPVLVKRLLRSIPTTSNSSFTSSSTFNKPLLPNVPPKSVGILRFLSSLASTEGSNKLDERGMHSLLYKELGITEEQLCLLTENHLELFNNVALLGTVLKTLVNLSDCAIGLTFESLSIPTRLLALTELQKIPSVIHSTRNLIWLTEDSKLIPKNGNNDEIKSLIPCYLVSNGELRQFTLSLLKGASEIFTNTCNSSPDTLTVLNKVWITSLNTQIRNLIHCLETILPIYSDLIKRLVDKYSTISDNDTDIEKCRLFLNEFKIDENSPTLSHLETLVSLYKSSIIAVISLNIKILTSKTDKKDAVQKKMLGHGNNSFKFFIESAVERDDIFTSLSDKFGYNILSYSRDLEDLLVPQNQKLRRQKIPKGTIDHMPNEMLIRSIVTDSIKDIFRQHGAVEIDTPVFELRETLLSKYGEDQKLIYDLKDQGGEQLSLRYDLTVPFARFVATNKIGKIKRFHIGKVYRRDEPQLTRGRYREFVQCDLDFAGECPRMVADSEVIFILIRILRLFKDDRFVVRINHRVILNAILSSCGVEQDKHATISSSIDKLDKEPWENVQNEMVNEKGLPESAALKIKEFVSINGSFNEVIDILKNKDINDINEALNDMLLLLSYFNVFGVKQTEITFDLSLARGLDYYTGVIFEAVLVGESVGSVGAGGRYDGLIGMFSGKNIPSVGMSVGIERILRTLATENAESNLTDVFVCTVGDSSMFLERMKLCNTLWSNSIKAEYLYNPNANLRKQLDAATDRGVSLVLILGETEILEGVVKVKMLGANGFEKVVKRSELPSELKVILSEQDCKLKRIQRKLVSKIC